MSAATFDDEAPDRAPADTLVVDVDGFEGPLDLLLSLARDQKVDLTRISILALAEQYLSFIDTARQLRLEVAADYLVMAAWLAYLKSRLLLPKREEEEEEPSGEELAAQLAFRLRRLEAMRAAADALMARARLNIGVFPRGMPEEVAIHRKVVHKATLYDLLSAYAAHCQRNSVKTVRVRKREVLTLQDARERLMRFVGRMDYWAPIDAYLTEYLARPEMRATARASVLSASLELVREGRVEIRQAAPFAPLFIRRRRDDTEQHDA